MPTFLYTLGLAAVVAATVLPSCGSKSCDGSAKWSFRIRVRDALTDAPICDATATASDGTTETPLTCLGGADCVCVGVAEQLGTFHVSVSKAGYQPASTTVKVDDQDDCHVITKDAAVSLTPQ